MKTLIDYVIGDQNNGIIDCYKTFEEADAAYNEAIENGIKLEMESMEEENMELAKERTLDFIFIAKRSRFFDEDGDELDQENLDFL